MTVHALLVSLVDGAHALSMLFWGLGLPLLFADEPIALAGRPCGKPRLARMLLVRACCL